MKNISKLAILLVVLTGNLFAACPTENTIEESDMSAERIEELQACGFYKLQDAVWIKDSKSASSGERLPKTYCALGVSC